MFAQPVAGGEARNLTPFEDTRAEDVHLSDEFPDQVPCLPAAVRHNCFTRDVHAEQALPAAEPSASKEPV